MRALLLVVTGLVGLALLGCSAVQEEQGCPGDDCPDGLAALSAEVAALPGVTDVRRTTWSSGLDDGVSGRVELVAPGVSAAEAGELARRVVALYLDADVEEPWAVEVDVAPQPLWQFGSAGRYSFEATNENWTRIRRS